MKPFDRQTSLLIDGCNMRQKDIARFWSKVEKSDGCWLWLASKSDQGYGYFRMGGKTHKAHRIAYETAYGKPPDDLLVCHYCDNPSCVRPEHLWLGTNRDNTLDRHRKGRTVICRNPGGYKLNNRKVPAVKLKNQQVDDMRARFSRGDTTIEALAAEYGVSRYTARDIIKYRARTSHLKRP